MRTDFLVIGSGIAGLSFAIKTSRTFPSKKITIICKSIPKETNTRYAQGGIAVAVDTINDSPEKHIQDTLAAGGKLCDKKVVEFVVREGPARLSELFDLGIHFDKKDANSYDLAKEGGHSSNRIFHRGDYTGLEIERKLLTEIRKLPNVIILSQTLAIDLITNAYRTDKKQTTDEKCYGAFIVDIKKKKVQALLAKITVMATGGIGQVFEHTTNATVATGDGIAMAHRAKAEISNMEFIQFHPTALFETDNGTNFLISEAVRGFGGILKTENGEPFMQKYDLRKDLATRDVVSRAINSELVKSNTERVFLDCRHISKKEFITHFPTISTKCLGLGIDPSQSMIPVVPSAHYCCGGIATDHFGNTSLPNLYACGECANTGLHGANRLASNSLLEALVFADRCYRDAARKINAIPTVKKNQLKNLGLEITEDDGTALADQVKVKRIMLENFRIINTFAGLERGIQELFEIEKRQTITGTDLVSLEQLQLGNMLHVSQLILTSSKKRKKNQGVFYNSDLEVRIEQKNGKRSDINPAFI